MKIEGVPYKTVDWNEIPIEEHKGETGAGCGAPFRRATSVRASSSTARATSPTTGARADTCCS